MGFSKPKEFKEKHQEKRICEEHFNVTVCPLDRKLACSPQNG